MDAGLTFRTHSPPLTSACSVGACSPIPILSNKLSVGARQFHGCFVPFAERHGYMDRLTYSGKIEEVYYVRLNPQEDILLALYDICRKNDIKTGVILDGSGAGINFTYQHFPINPKFSPTNVVIGTMEGNCEMSLQGTIGNTVCNLPKEDADALVDGMFPNIEGYLETPLQKWRIIGSDGGDGQPYIHAHCVGSNKDCTVCGHLMPGTIVASGNSEKPSHFTVIIAKISGVEMQAIVDAEQGFHQDIVSK